MNITSRLFEAYLKCPTKYFLRSLGETGAGNAYADWARTKIESYLASSIKHLIERSSHQESVIGPLDSGSLKTVKWRLATSVMARGNDIESNLHAVECIPQEERGKVAQFIPIRFVSANKVTRDDRRMLAFDALALSEVLGRDSGLGRIIYGDDYTVLTVKTGPLVGNVRRQIGRISDLISSTSPPELILNRHCGECEFRDRCRQKALEKDDLSLLSSISEKERKKLNNKGIFTVTQLSHTFRPRRRSRRLRNKKEKYHHSLKALAIRDRKIYLVGTPELRIEGTPIYLDVEALPDRDFYYLIGLLIGNSESAVQHSLWADTIEDERRIWNEFLDIISKLENPVLFHYGSFETTFFKRMVDRYGKLPENSAAANAVKASTNLLSVIYAQIYFPTFSNGLKDTAAFLGFKWTDHNSSGLQSIVWRNHWENSRDTQTKENLIEYNAQDCEALSVVTTLIRTLSTQTIGQNSGAPVVDVDSVKFPQKSKWKNFTSSISGFEFINSAAHWNYQRDRIYVRSGVPRRKTTKRPPRQRFFRRIDKVVMWERQRSCPNCGSLYRAKERVRSKIVQDILFGRHSVRRRLIEYVFQTYRCRKCGKNFGIPRRFKSKCRYGWDLIAYLFYHIIGLRIPQRTAVQSFNRLFDFDLPRSSVNNLKIKVAAYYADTKQEILERIVQGNLVHADETRANIKGRSAFVWVFTNMHEVAYVLAESREGEVAQRLLENFKGVLVSDFYTAYDSIGCPQQKCLIHLMRDLNEEVLNNPFDEPLKQLVSGFGDLLKPMIETVDRYGLKKYFLKKHIPRVSRFYDGLDKADYQSEAALKCKERFKRNRENLFTFLEFDGIPWNNNNAEHAIKAFARLRDILEGTSTEKGTNEYLTLLSISQTCEYQGLDFLDFLRSGEKSINVFAGITRKHREKIVREPTN